DPRRGLGGAQGWWSAGARRVYAEKAPFAVLAAVAAVIAFVAIVRLGNMAPLERLGLPERLAVSVFGLAFYLWKTLLPVGLSPLYGFPARVDLAAPRYLLSFAVVGLVSLLAVVARHRAPWLAAAWIVYVVTLLPVVGILQNGPQIAADRYTYLACLPWALLIGGAVAVALRCAAGKGREAALAPGEPSQRFLQAGYPAPAARRSRRRGASISRNPGAGPKPRLRLEQPRRGARPPREVRRGASGVP